MKLTLICIACRGYVVTAFIQLPIINDKPFLSNKIIDTLFLTNFGFIPTLGETITTL
jgi:hypothetical protein